MIEAFIYLFLGVFSITAIITLLGITNVITSIREKHLNALFVSLILEVIGAVIFAFNKIDLNHTGSNFTSQDCYHDLTHSASLQLDSLSDYQKKQFIIDKLRASSVVCDTRQLQEQIHQLTAEREACQSSLDEVSAGYYFKVENLRKLIRSYNGSINLRYQPEEKEDVYELLKSIFEVLGYIKTDRTDFQAIQEYYRQFELNYGVHDETQLLITDYETALLVWEYLKIVERIRQ